MRRRLCRGIRKNSPLIEVEPDICRTNEHLRVEPGSDQLRYQSCGYAGDALATTPNIDRLARQGCSFRQAVSSTPVCAPYRASLFTGKYQSSNGMVINELRLSPEHECLGHVLTRDALYDQLPALERSRMHERVGTVLETDYRHHIRPQVALLAHHFTAALPAAPAGERLTRSSL